MHTKTVIIDTDWLREIDGRTVAYAIEYLKQFNPDYVLDASLEGGDTHGVEIVSNLHHNVPMTNSEILEKLEAAYADRVAGYIKEKAYFTKKGQLDRLPAIEAMMQGAYNRIVASRVKYGNEDIEDES